MPCAMANSSQEDHQVIFSRLYNEYVPCIVDFGGHLSLTNKSRYDFYKFVQQLLVAENSGTHVMETVLLSWTSLLRSAISCDRTQMGWFISSNPTPLKNDGLRTSWDDEIYEIPNIYIYKPCSKPKKTACCCRCCCFPCSPKLCGDMFYRCALSAADLLVRQNARWRQLQIPLLSMLVKLLQIISWGIVKMIIESYPPKQTVESHPPSWRL